MAGYVGKMGSESKQASKHTQKKWNPKRIMDREKEARGKWSDWCKTQY